MAKEKYMKKKIIVLALVVVLLIVTGCSERTEKSPYNMYTNTFFETFNTLTVVMAYTETQEEFQTYFDYIESRFQELHKLYDIYNSYEGINNLRTINENAGKEPVVVQKEIIDLIVLAKEWNNTIGPLTNIAMGPVLRIWHEYRMDGNFDPTTAKIPPMELLENANKYTDINKVIVDTENSTVFLEDPRMRLDIGALAKGYAAEIVAQEVYEMGMKSGIISAGGNVRTIGQHLDGRRNKWGIGIQDPDSSIVSQDANLDVAFIENASVVSSGDYQRYYFAEGLLLHHLIDPATLMPATHYRAVTVITEHSGYADFVSTELFLLPYEESRALADSLEDIEAVWVMPDGEMRYTDGMKKLLRSQGATNQIK